MKCKQMKYTHNLEANISILSNLCFDTLNNIFEFLDFVNLLNLSQVNKSLNKNLKTLIKDKINNFVKKNKIELLNFLQIKHQKFYNSHEFTCEDYDIFAFLCIKKHETIGTNDILIREYKYKARVIFPLQMILKTILSSTNKVTIDFAYINLSLIELNLISSFLNFTFRNYCWNIELDYTNCMIYDIDFNEIMNILKVNTTITKLKLKNIRLYQYNNKLTEALLFNTFITELDLTNTEIFKYESTKFLEALKKNTHLTKLNLSKNYINKDIIEELIEVLKVNMTLTNIYISYNEEIISYQSTIKAALLRNNKLTKLKNKETKKLSNILVTFINLSYK